MSDGADEAGSHASRTLIDTGGLAKKDRMTHGISLASPDELNPFVVNRPERAYGLDAFPTAARSLATRAPAG